MEERYVGYGLLIVGILVMLSAVWQVYLVLTGQLQPYPLFHMNSLVFDMKALLGNVPGASALPSGKTSIELLSAENFNKTTNITLDFFLMSFVLTLGFRLSNLGVMLIRPVVVKLQAAKDGPRTPAV